MRQPCPGTDRVTVPWTSKGAAVSIEENKRVVANFVEVCQNQHNLTAADEIFHPDFVNHYAPEGRPIAPTPRPAGGFQAFYGMLLRAFPDATMEINEQLAERDLVATRKTLRGTHRGELWGLPPTGNRVEWEFMTSSASGTESSWSTGRTWTSRPCACRCARASRPGRPGRGRPRPGDLVRSQELCESCA